MTKFSHTPRTYHDAEARAHQERSRAFHEGLSSLTAWISGGKPQGNH